MLGDTTELVAAEKAVVADVARFRRIEKSSGLGSHHTLANGFSEAVASAMNNTAIIAPTHKRVTA